MHEPDTTTTQPDTGLLDLPRVVRTRARLLALAPMMVLAAIIGCISLSVATAVLAISDPFGPGGDAAVLCGVIAGLFGVGAFAMYVTTDQLFEAIVDDLDELHDTRSQGGAS